jgi:hypothetical protein
VSKLHERMHKDWMRRQRAAADAAATAAAAQAGVATNADYQKRVEALKNNDMEAYRELLAEARGREGTVVGGAGGGAAGEAGGGAGEGVAADARFASLQEFLEKTEEYLQNLGGKIAATKLSTQRQEAAAAAAADAEARGLSEVGCCELKPVLNPAPGSRS